MKPTDRAFGALCVNVQGDVIGNDGVDVRTYAAIQICAGLNSSTIFADAACEKLAEYSVKQADALIAELNKAKP